MTLIAKSQDLADFCTRNAGVDYLTVDTEFLRDSTYWPKLCLIQVGGPEEAVAVDALAEGMDLSPLLALFRDERIMKVLHSARQDMEIFFQIMDGDLPRPIFDTQVAAMVCGFGDQVAYDTLARKLAGAQVDKASRFADWSHRPLTERQLDYALADVTHLRPVYEALAAKLEANGRAPWLREEMATLSDPATYRMDPEQAWRRLKSRSSDARYLTVLRAVAAWREREAQRRDVPRNRVIRDEALLDIAGHAPRTPKDLARTRGLTRDFANGRLGQELIAAVEEALALPEDERVKPKPREDLPSGLGPLIDLLKVLLKTKCDRHGVAQKLVATSPDLERIAADDEADVAPLKGWRREIFGEDALALKHGRLALAAQGSRVRLIEVEPAPPKAKRRRRKADDANAESAESAAAE